MEGHRLPSKMRIASDPCTGAPCGCPLRISPNGGKNIHLGGHKAQTAAQYSPGRAQGTGGHKAGAGTRRRPYAHPRRASRPFGNGHRLGPVYGRPLWVSSSDFAKRQRKIFIWTGAWHQRRRNIHQDGFFEFCLVIR